MNRLGAFIVVGLCLVAPVVAAAEAEYSDTLGQDFVLAVKNYEQKYSVFSATAEIIYHSDIERQAVSQVSDCTGTCAIKRLNDEYLCDWDWSVAVVGDGENSGYVSRSFFLSTPSAVYTYDFGDGRLTIEPPNSVSVLWRTVGLDSVFTLGWITESQIKARIIERDGRSVIEGFASYPSQLDGQSHILLVFDVGTGNLLRSEVWHGGVSPGAGTLNQSIMLTYAAGKPVCLEKRWSENRPEFSASTLIESTAMFTSFVLNPNIKRENLRFKLPQHILVDDKIMGSFYRTEVSEGLLW